MRAGGRPAVHRWNDGRPCIYFPFRSGPDAVLDGTGNWSTCTGACTKSTVVFTGSIATMFNCCFYSSRNGYTGISVKSHDINIK